MIAPASTFEQQSFFLAAVRSQSGVCIVNKMIQTPVSFTMLSVQVPYDLCSVNFSAVKCLEVIHNIILGIKVGG